MLAEMKEMVTRLRNAKDTEAADAIVHLSCEYDALKARTDALVAELKLLREKTPADLAEMAEQLATAMQIIELQAEDDNGRI
jgi:cell division protein FtsB